MTTPADDLALIATLNRDCFCIGTDLERLHAWLTTDLAERGLSRPIVESHPTLFSALPVFVTRSQIERMRSVIEAVEHVVALPGYAAAALRHAPAIARRAPRNAGVLMGYDFHLADAGPRLIEINTNAGGALLNAALARAQRACCPEVEALLCGEAESRSLEDDVLASFLEEWRAARGATTLRRVAIVDRAPVEQYLYPEFLLFARLFESQGIDACIVDPAELEFDGRTLAVRGLPIDLVYNRLTDFYLEEPAAAALARAYAADAVVTTPHPHAHALYANKRNLALLTDAAALRGFGADAATIDTLLAGIPETVLVDERNAERLWDERRNWFFKPVRGFGSRGSYRGDKMTRKVFAAIRAANYVAQRIVPPSERRSDDSESSGALKVDLRNYVYRGHVQMVTARLYRGQTTNFRTPGGGFAPVFHPRHDGDCGILAGRCPGRGDPAGADPAGSNHPITC